MLHQLQFDMQHPKKKNIWPFNPTPVVEDVCKGKIFASMVLYASFPFDMQHDHILKKLFFGVGPTPLVHIGDRTLAFNLKSCLIFFIHINPLSACKISVKMLTFDPA